MFPSHAVHWLEQYHESLAVLVREPADPSSYRRNTEVFEAMRGLTASLPLVQVCWVEVLISRFELLDALVRVREDEAAQGRTGELLQRHHETLEALRALCGRGMH